MFVCCIHATTLICARISWLTLACQRLCIFCVLRERKAKYEKPGAWPDRASELNPRLTHFWGTTKYTKHTKEGARGQRAQKYRACACLVDKKWPAIGKKCGVGSAWRL